jgi:hypothetical protein
MKLPRENLTAAEGYSMFEKSVFVGADMFCEEYEHLESEWNASRGEWVYFRLSANNRAAGITEEK